MTWAEGRVGRFGATLVAALVLALPAAASAPFPEWLEGLRQEALDAGVAAATLDAALGDIAPIARVIELDRRQPEFTLTFQEYLERVVPERRVRQGRELLARHRDLLDEVGAHYGVQPRFIVALWGVETDFGRLTGGFPVIAALATLAHDGRRSAYFRSELLNALKILDAGHIAVDAMSGSWAGAMGQVQFMPSSYLSYAQDWDGDGRKDIWTTTADAFASAANYLANAGWQVDQTWGREVRIPAELDPSLIGHDLAKGLLEWQELGVRRSDGSDLPGRNLRASLVRPGGDGGPLYLVYDNFRALLRWNRSDYFATAVGILSDRIGRHP